ncbi:MAG: heme-binding domain-containing protein [Saprospiraceae bacterium]|nr:heme-binding domain-containing protein [Saprospiraceae bacterium]
MLKKYGKRILQALLGILLIAQFIRPAKNQSGDAPGDLTSKYKVPDEVMALLKPACYDCHSNYTRYPWYAEIQPVGWWLAQHVNEGKKHLNFSTFTNRKVAIQNHKFEEIIEMVKEGEMPMASYTWTHRDAILSKEQQSLITGWAQSMMDSLKNQYPADSLVLKRR